MIASGRMSRIPLRRRAGHLAWQSFGDDVYSLGVLPAHGGRGPLQARLASSVVRADARMVIFHDSRRFELTVAAHYDEWVARLVECVPGRLLPTQHLLRAFDTRQEAINALVRKWRLLFPDAEPLVWREPPAVQPQRLSRKHPRPPRSQE